MDLVPKPDQVVAAAGNVGRMLLQRGVADLRPMPRTLIDAGPRRQVFVYEPSAGTPATGEPVLLVAPLAAPAICFDLRRGCSLVEHLVEGGRPTYLVEYGAVSLRTRDLGLEPWVDKVVPDAVRTVSEHAGGKPVHVVGWSLGGIFALLAAAGADLPIASLSVLGSPVDVMEVPMLAPARPLLGDAPARCAPMPAARPTPPAPTTTRESPAHAPTTFVTAPTPVTTAHPAIAATAAGMLSRTFTALRSGTTTCSAKHDTPRKWFIRSLPCRSRPGPSSSPPPWACTGPKTHMTGWPRRQGGHEPQLGRHINATRSPGATDVTPSPTAATRPAPSCPSPAGSGDGPAWRRSRSRCRPTACARTAASTRR